MVLSGMKMMTTSRNPDVKADRSMMRMFRTVLAMGCLGALVAGSAGAVRTLLGLD